MPADVPVHEGSGVDLGREDGRRLSLVAGQGGKDQLAAVPGPEVLTDQLLVLVAGEHLRERAGAGQRP